MESQRVNNEPVVAVLFARQDSIYKQLEACEVYDIERDARTSKVG